MQAGSESKQMVDSCTTALQENNILQRPICQLASMRSEGKQVYIYMSSVPWPKERMAGT